MTKQVNDRGVYAVTFNFGGEKKVVIVDDYIPMTHTHRKIDGKWQLGWHPVYAKSRVDGELWPMLAEKAWAKINGSYAAIGNGGQNSMVMDYLSDDPYRYFRLQGYQTDNDQGKNLWGDLKRY